MSELNDRPFTILFRQGTAANLATATTFLSTGEPAYTTDTKQVYIGDGTNKLNLLSANVTTNITVGYTVTPANGGTLTTGGTFTATAAAGNYQYYTNNGAHTFANPSADGAMDVLVTNGANAGTITFSTFATGTHGDSLTMTTGNQFIISVRRINSVSVYIIKALQ